MSERIEAKVAFRAPNTCKRLTKRRLFARRAAEIHT
jgi:hypothetical protein